MVGPRYTEKYATAAENSLSRCYRACLELLVESELRRWERRWWNSGRERALEGILCAHACVCVFVYVCGCMHACVFVCKAKVIFVSPGCLPCSIALPCIYSDAKGYPREPAAHVAIREWEGALPCTQL